jgi:hypothetical protein
VKTHQSGGHPTVYMSWSDRRRAYHMNSGVTMRAAVHNVYTHQTSAKLCQAVNALRQTKGVGREISLRRIVIGGIGMERLSSLY